MDEKCNLSRTCCRPGFTILAVGSGCKVFVFSCSFQIRGKSQLHTIYVDRSCDKLIGRSETRGYSGTSSINLDYVQTGCAAWLMKLQGDTKNCLHFLANVQQCWILIFKAIVIQFSFYKIQKLCFFSQIQRWLVPWSVGGLCQKAFLSLSLLIEVVATRKCTIRDSSRIYHHVQPLLCVAT